MTGEGVGGREAEAGPSTMTVADARRIYAGPHDGCGVDVGRVTLQTVADKVGVSRMTVSNAFSRPDQLSAALREQILAAAAELGYAGPDPAARALVRGSVGAVGVVLTDSLGEAFRDPVAAAFLGAVAEELAPTGLAVTLLPALAVGDHLPARDLALDAALVYACAGEKDAVRWLTRRRLPLVFVDQEPPPGSAGVVLDERAGGRLQAQHLIDLGHRDIVVFTMNSDDLEPHWAPDPRAAGSDHVSRGRVAGALEALDAAGLEARVYEVKDNHDRWIVPGARAVVADPRRPTGVVCFSDAMAAALVRAAQDVGLSVPRDLSVVGFDDTVLARALRPALTTVRQDFLAKGRAAAHALTDAIARTRGGGEALSGTVTIPVELVVRDSTAPPAERR